MLMTSVLCVVSLKPHEAGNASWMSNALCSSTDTLYVVPRCIVVDVASCKMWILSTGVVCALIVTSLCSN